ATEKVKPDPSELTTNRNAASSITLRRPHLSASRPAYHAPTAHPSRATETMKPVRNGFNSKCELMESTAPLMAEESNPKRKPPTAAAIETPIALPCAPDVGDSEAAFTMYHSPSRRCPRTSCGPHRPRHETPTFPPGLVGQPFRPVPRWLSSAGTGAGGRARSAVSPPDSVTAPAACGSTNVLPGCPSHASPLAVRSTPAPESPTSTEKASVSVTLDVGASISARKNGAAAGGNGQRLRRSPSGRRVTSDARRSGDQAERSRARRAVGNPIPR